jgi:hypothetical protein
MVVRDADDEARSVNAALPTILLEELLQHVRDFELRHFEVELQFQIEAPELSGQPFILPFLITPASSRSRQFWVP